MLDARMHDASSYVLFPVACNIAETGIHLTFLIQNMIDAEEF